MLDITIKTNLTEYIKEDLGEIKVGYWLITKKLSEKIQDSILLKVSNRGNLKYTPVKTGYLRDNFKATSITKRYNSFHGKVYNNTPYAEIVEYGTKPLSASARLKSDKRRLAHQEFMGESGYSLEELSNHNGRKRAMLRRATEDTELLIENLFLNVWRDKDY